MSQVDCQSQCAAVMGKWFRSLWPRQWISVSCSQVFAIDVSVPMCVVVIVNVRSCLQS